jgi:2-polyprenyl-3-methyl-5-hydroxy-6-metoxy-1,4-benzoquinol methylase
MDLREIFEANRQLWNKRTNVHKDSAFYDVAGFNNGKTALNKIELDGLGDVTGKKILHLQCHFGLDSLSLSRMGAKVTGIDLSDEAISEAKRLNELNHLDADFYSCNIYDLLKDETSPLPAQALGSFDIVFTSYGVVGWLPDLDQWANVIARYLKKGGIFFMAEFHPVVWMFDDNFTRIQYSYAKDEMIVVESQGTYADKAASIEAKEYSWNHSLGEVINGLINQQLTIVSFEEYMYSPYPCFNRVVKNPDGQWWIEGLENKIPMVYAIKAVK